MFILSQYQCWCSPRFCNRSTFFLIYINDLCNNLQCNAESFAENTSLLSTVKMPERTASNLNNELKEINK